MAEPSVLNLYLKTVFFLLVFGLAGWSVFPQKLFNRDNCSNFLYWIISGILILFLSGFIMTRLSVRGLWIPAVAFFLISGRIAFLVMKKGKREDFSFVQSRIFWKELSIFIAVNIIIASIFFLPFMNRNTSGILAYGGGDQSSYFGLSEYAKYHTFDEALSEVKGDPLQILPGQANFAVKSLAAYIKIGQQNVYAPQTLSLPFLAMGWGSDEESYTAETAVFICLAAWTALLLVNINLKKRIPVLLFLFTVLIGGISKGIYSLALKSALPALFVWTICLFVLCCLLYIKDRPIVIIRFPSLYIGIFLVSATVLYLPSLVLLMPVYAFLFSVIQNRESMIWKKISLGVLFCFIIGNLELLRPVRLILSNVNVVLDYGVNWEHIFTAVTGVLDFETVLTLWKHTTEYHFYLSYAIVAGSVLFLFSIRKTNATAFLILFLLAGINIYMYKQKKGDYQIVRLSDFISVLLPVFSLYGYYLILKKIKYLPYILSGAFASLYLFLSVNDKKLFMRIAENDVVETRFSLKSSEDIQAVSELSEIYESRKKAGKSPVFYYMGWGVVDSANNEIIYRKIPYFESIEYDYTPRGIDILSKKYLEHALFVYPAGFLPDFLSVSSSYKAQTVSKIPGLKVFDATKGKGICLIGTGWFPYHDNLLYMRDGLEKALVIWSDSDEAVLLNFSLLTAHMSFEGYISAVSDFEYEMPAGYIDDHSVADKNEKHMKAKEFRIPLKRQSGELKVNLAFKVNKGMNVIRLIQRNDKGERSGLVLYTGINYSGQGKVSDLFLKRIKLNRILSPLSVNGRFQILTETDLKKMDIEN